MKKRRLLIVSICFMVLLVTFILYTEAEDKVTFDLSQKLPEKIQFNNAKLNEVLAYLTNTTGINITCSTGLANLNISVNIAEGETIKQVLDYLNKTYNLDYMFCSDGKIVFMEKYTYDIQQSGEYVQVYEEVSKMKMGAIGRPLIDYGSNTFYADNNQKFNTEEYDRIYENTFFNVLDNPLSTFAIDVDTASYANIRRYLNQEQLPPADAVRIEEMINYFNYNYPAPAGAVPFSITTEAADCPWNKKNKLVLVGLQGEKVETKNMPPNNLVFLIDVSGSMQDANKLPLLKKALKLMVNQLRAEDRVSIVVYAGRSAVVLDSTSGKEKQKIATAIDKLGAGGSTAGSAGIKKAYQIAKQNYLQEGNNRVILATDGDFNVGVSSTGDLVRMIEEKRDDGIFLTVLGFGTGNYKGSRMEELSNKGNGNYAYIDNLLEAKKVLVNELGGTLLTIAKDVKIQLEFNPAKVKEYRLIGYENRVMENKDFADDSKDAGELGAGHSVTALYELVMTDKDNLKNNNIDISSDLTYQETVIKEEAYKNNELMTVKLRYKEPDEKESKLITTTVIDQELTVAEASSDFKFATAVAGFGMLLRDSEFKGESSYQNIINLAKEAKGEDEFGYRAEFIKLVEMAELINQTIVE